VIHLDTSFLVDVLRELGRQRPGPALRFLDDHPDDPIAVSAFVAAELWAGAELSARPAHERERVGRLLSALHVVYPDDRFPPTYGRLLASLTRAGRRIATMDLLIASAAVADQAALVTRNRSDFGRVPDLEILAY
jgi:tRNA(fMet)-specific endonuclease VapC